MAGRTRGPHCRPMSPLRPVTDLSTRRAAREAALPAAGAPALHVTQDLLDALNCRGEWAADGQPLDLRPRRLRAV